MKKIHESNFANYFIERTQNPNNLENKKIIREYKKEQVNFSDENKAITIFEVDNNFYFLLKIINFGNEKEEYYQLEIDFKNGWLKEFFKENLDRSSGDEELFISDLKVINSLLSQETL